VNRDLHNLINDSIMNLVMLFIVMYFAFKFDIPYYYS